MALLPRTPTAPHPCSNRITTLARLTLYPRAWCKSRTLSLETETSEIQGKDTGTPMRRRSLRTLKE